MTTILHRLPGKVPFFEGIVSAIMLTRDTFLVFWSFCNRVAVPMFRRSSLALSPFAKWTRQPWGGHRLCGGHVVVVITNSYSDFQSFDIYIFNRIFAAILWIFPFSFWSLVASVEGREDVIVGIEYMCMRMWLSPLCSSPFRRL
jgi:hypothetical protein